MSEILIIFAAEIIKRCLTMNIRFVSGAALALSLLFFLPCAVPCGAQKADVRVPNVGIGVNRRTPDSRLSSNFNVGLFANVDTLRGMQLSLITGVTHREMRGVNVSALAAVSHGRAYGVQLAGLVNAGSGDMRGLQMASVANVAARFNGVQLAGLTNACTTPMRGIQLSAVTNISMGVKRGVQISGAANVCSSYMRGLQMSAYNYADTLNGSQIGLLNVCVSHPRGMQVGLINYSRDTTARKIGLVNINPSTQTDLMVYGGSSVKLNMAMRFRNRSTYNIIGIGYNYMGFDDEFSGAVYYRLGQYISLSRYLTLSGDIGFYHVEAFAKHSADSPDRLYSLQARVSLDCRLGHTLGAFVTAGYGDTRYYHHSRRYRDRAIAEAGLTLRLPPGTL